MDLTYCPRCNQSSLGPSNRLITEHCGHVKCRECFINDMDGCHECVKQTLQIAETPLSDTPSVQNSDSILADIESESGDLCIDTEVDDSTTFDGPIARNEPSTITDSSADTREAIIIDRVVNVLQNFSKTHEIPEETNGAQESLKILEEYIIAPKSKIEKFFRETKLTTSVVTGGYQQPERKKSLPEHVVKITENGETFYRCNECGKRFRSRNQQYYHAYCGDSEKKPHRCKICQKAFSTSSHLNYHVKTHDTSKYPCNLCSKTFMRSISLKSHKRTHDGLFRFKCKECGLGFNERKSFTAHINKHRNILPFMCKVCGKKFSFKSNLTQHQKIHTGLGKRFRCDDCGKEFLRKNSFKEHLVRHSKVKKFQCKVCQSFFIDRKTLERHMNTHGSKVYKCPNCDVKCGRKDNLVRHIRNMHPSEDITNIMNNIKMVIVAEVVDNEHEPHHEEQQQQPTVVVSGLGADPIEHIPDENMLAPESQQPIVVSTSVIRSVGNVKPVHIPIDCDLTNVGKASTTESMSVAVHDRIESNAVESAHPLNTSNKSPSNSNSDKNNEQRSTTSKDVKKPKKKYDPCEIYRKILFANDDGDDSVLESEEFYADSRDDHIGCCDMNAGLSNNRGTDARHVNAGRTEIAPSNFSEVHWRKRTSQSFYTSL